MKYIVFISVLTSLISFDINAQMNESELYQQVYTFLNDSILKNDFPTASEFALDCNECCVKGILLKFKPDIQVADKFIKNNYGFPLEDFVTKRYSLSDDCLKSLRSGVKTCELSNQVLDSLDRFWENYEMKSKEEIGEALKDLLSDTKEGYQVFFSDIYKNTIAAELKGFCLPYDDTNWMGRSTSFYFVFDDKGKIKEIYRGVTIHYN